VDKIVADSEEMQHEAHFAGNGLLPGHNPEKVTSNCSQLQKKIRFSSIIFYIYGSLVMGDQITDCRQNGLLR
jgi:hypothetical protein